MGSVNRAVVLGNLGKDPEVRSVGDSKVANFSVATSEKFKDRDGNTQERTEWHRISAWGKLADVCGNYLRKGRQVYVEGKLQTRDYEKDGQKHYATEIIATSVVLLNDGQGQQGASAGSGGRSNGGGRSAPPQGGGRGRAPTQQPEDDGFGGPPQGKDDGRGYPASWDE